MAAPGYTYSFLDVVCSLNGPSGIISLGAGAAIAEEGIDIEPSVDANHMDVGADGSSMHSLSANKSATATVRLLRASVVNYQLQQMYNIQRGSGLLWGQNNLSVGNPVSGDKITGAQVAFRRQPSIPYKVQGGFLIWTFDIGLLDTTLGGSLLSQLLGAVSAAGNLVSAIPQG